jgi:hypothetical protein
VANVNHELLDAMRGQRRVRVSIRSYGDVNMRVTRITSPTRGVLEFEASTTMGPLTFTSNQVLQVTPEE